MTTKNDSKPLLDKQGVMGTNVPLPSTTEVVTKQEIEFKKLAVEIITMTVEVGEKYLGICLFIRKHSLAPKQVTTWLKDVGFHKVRIAEINRIAHGPDEIFDKFKARMIGWRGALQLTRGNIDEMKKVTEVTNDPSLVALAAECEAEAVREEEAAQEATPSDPDAKRKSRVLGLDKKAAGILSGAEAWLPKGKSWTNGTYTLTLSKKQPSKGNRGKLPQFSPAVTKE